MADIRDLAVIYKKIKAKMIKAIILFILIVPSLSYSKEIADYLILQDIGAYKLDVPEAVFKGEPPIGGARIYDSSGIVAGADHFYKDHTDKSYEVIYIGGNGMPSPTVQVTQHDGSDSDNWLLHEIDMEFRNYFGIPGQSYSYRQIDDQNVMEVIAGGRDYRWISGNKVIMIEYHDSQLNKSEPIEVVKAYLSKHPSTLTPIGLVELRSDAKVTRWIKDEMDRRLWLCDKWVTQKEAGVVVTDELLLEIHGHMKVFLNYKKKYYGIETDDDINTIYRYMQTKDETSMKNNLAQYQSWWESNKDGAIILPEYINRKKKD